VEEINSKEEQTAKQVGEMNQLHTRLSNGPESSMLVDMLLQLQLLQSFY